MSKPQHTFYDLTFSVEAPFWGEGEASSRRTYIMPSPHNPSEFLAFGVEGASDAVRFVARGPVTTRLGDFIDRMVQAESSVEFHARAPVRGDILQQYLGGGPWEGKIPEEPPPPPSDGRIALSSGEGMSGTPTTDFSSTVPLWPTGNPHPRHVYVLQTPGSDRFLAIGVLRNTSRAPFVARGLVSTHLDAFLRRMGSEGATVEHCTELPLSRLHTYLALHASTLQ